MTIHEVASSLHGLSVGGYFNGERFTVSRLENQIAALFRGTPKGGNRLVFQIALPDGWWYFNVSRFADRPDGYDYYIPETREQEERVKAILFS